MSKVGDLSRGKPNLAVVSATGRLNAKNEHRRGGIKGNDLDDGNELEGGEEALRESILKGNHEVRRTSGILTPLTSSDHGSLHR